MRSGGGEALDGRSSLPPKPGPGRRAARSLRSDALLDNKISEAAHLALGFEETEQIRCFKKNL